MRKDLMNIFEEAYAGVQFAHLAYKAAANGDERETARELYKEATAKIKDLTEVERYVWEAYAGAKDRGNEYIDFDGVIQAELVEDLVKCLRDCGIKAFTFSSTWSSTIETAWLFQKAGCNLAGLVELNSSIKSCMSDEFEKVPGYLFNVNQEEEK